MKVHQLMTSPVTTISPGTPVREVARALLQGDFSGLPVVDQQATVVGMVTEDDVVAKHARVHAPSYFGILGEVLPLSRRRNDDEIRHALAVTAADLMSSQFVAVGPDDDVDDAASLMVERDANPLPVIENGRLVGILSRSDIIGLLLREEDDDGSQPGAGR